MLAGASSIAAAGGSGNVDIATQPEYIWNAASDAAWITELTPASGQGNGQLQFRAAANPDPAAREGDLVVNDARIQVVQDTAPCRFDIQPGNLAMGAAGGSINISVPGNGDDDDQDEDDDSGNGGKGNGKDKDKDDSAA